MEHDAAVLIERIMNSTYSISNNITDSTSDIQNIVHSTRTRLEYMIYTRINTKNKK